MMTVMHGLSTSPMQGFSLLVLVLMNSALGMVDTEQVIDEEGISMIMVNCVLVSYLCLQLTVDNILFILCCRDETFPPILY